MRARRRLGAVASPGVERREQTALRPAVVVGVLLELTAILRRRKVAGAVFGACQLIDADIRRVLEVPDPSMLVCRMAATRPRSQYSDDESTRNSFGSSPAGISLPRPSSRPVCGSVVVL